MSRANQGRKRVWIMECSASRVAASECRVRSTVVAGIGYREFDHFYRQEFPCMVALARSICGDRSWAEDLAQEALAKAHQNWARVSGYDRPGAWLRRVTINLAISRRRWLQRECNLVRRKALERPPDPPTSSSDSKLWDAVRRLPPRQRTVVAMFYQEDRSTKDIANILGCSISTATSHLNQARSRLGKELGR